jgi:hypothetical protein
VTDGVVEEGDVAAQLDDGKEDSNGSEDDDYFVLANQVIFNAE